MRFLLVTFDFPPSIGGIQTRVDNYVKNLVRSGHDVFLAHLVEPEDAIWHRFALEGYGVYVVCQTPNSVVC